MRLQDGIPRHAQISQWLRTEIEQGRFSPNEKLPSENELCKMFEVSRVTVRKALQTLENEQLIYRSQGLGSFVGDLRPRQWLLHLTDFEEDMRKAGMEAVSRVIRQTVEPVPERVASLLRLHEGDKVLRLVRLRLGDGQPIALDITWLPLFYGQLINGYDLEKETIFRILERDYDIPVQKGFYRIQAENADARVAEYLQVEPGRALLLMDRLSLTTGDKPVYYQKRYIRSDRMMYELVADRGDGGRQGESNMPLREFLPIFNREES